MAYSDVWTHANDETFQGRCWAALWDCARRAVADEAGYPDASQVSAQPQDDDDFAVKILTDKTRLTGRQLAQQVLRNATVAVNPATSNDSDILFTLRAEIWADLRDIG